MIRAVALLILAVTAGATPAAKQPLEFDGGARGADLLPKFAPALTGSAEAADMVTETVFTMDGMEDIRVPRAVLEGPVSFDVVAFDGGEGFIDSNVPAAIQAQLRGDLDFVKSIRGSLGSRLHRQIFGPVDGPTYAEFFASRVKHVGLGNCGSNNAVACVYVVKNPSKMWLTQNYIRFSHPQIARLMIVFHESRHTETQNKGWRHAACPNPFLDENGKEIRSIWTGSALAGQAACDITPLGSYSSSMIMLKNISKYCASCTEKVRTDAGLYADDQLKRVIDPAARKAILDDLYR